MLLLCGKMYVKLALKTVASCNDVFVLMATLEIYSVACLLNENFLISCKTLAQLICPIFECKVSMLSHALSRGQLT